MARRALASEQPRPVHHIPGHAPGSAISDPGGRGGGRADRLAKIERIADPYEPWQAQQRLARCGSGVSVAWDATFSPVKSVSLLWAAGDRHSQEQLCAAHLTAVDAGLGHLEEHATFVRAGRSGVKVLDSDGLVVARMNERASRDGDLQLHTHCLILNRARTTVDGKWRVLDGRPLLAAQTAGAATYHRVLAAELTRRLGVAWRDRPEGLREIDGAPEELIEAFSTRRWARLRWCPRVARPGSGWTHLIGSCSQVLSRCALLPGDW